MNSSTLTSTKAHAPETIPRGALIAIGVLLALTVAATAAVRLSGVDVRAPDAAALQTRALHFQDLPDGGVAVLATDRQTEVARLQGEQGFVRGALRALVRERRLRGLDQTEPFYLIGRADGRLTLEDRATGQRINLESFGPMHAREFGRLLDVQHTDTTAGR
ncbi:MAG: photosynthetic complex assembly protein PuhC [Burkholderiales bacterium]|jgi:putative photosynthetic complex assembly protein|nr:photosynthetic complex assembly protein PuhC [Burkholderiales bacterium]